MVAYHTTGTGTSCLPTHMLVSRYTKIAATAPDVFVSSTTSE